MQVSLEREARHIQAFWDQHWSEAKPEYGLLTNQFAQHANAVVNTWWTLFDTLLFKYADGWDNEPTLGVAIGYPAWWLQKVGYKHGPPPVAAPHDTYSRVEEYPPLPKQLAESSL